MDLIIKQKTFDLHGTLSLLTHMHYKFSQIKKCRILCRKCFFLSSLHICMESVVFWQQPWVGASDGLFQNDWQLTVCTQDKAIYLRLPSSAVRNTAIILLVHTTIQPSHKRGGWKRLRIFYKTLVDEILSDNV